MSSYLLVLKISSPMDDRIIISERESKNNTQKHKHSHIGPIYVYLCSFLVYLYISLHS